MTHPTLRSVVWFSGRLFANGCDALRHSAWLAEVGTLARHSTQDSSNSAVVQRLSRNK